jgi:hypothetical protein
MFRKLKASDIALEEAVEGRVIYLLILVVLVQFGYPITAYGTWALVIYEILYASMIIVGVIVGRDSPRHMLILAVSGFVFLAAGIVYALNPAARWAIILTYLALIPYLGLLVSILARFLTIMRVITLDVLYAATAIYLLLGGIFVPLYGMLETFVPGSIRDSGAGGGSLQWQQVVYFSYTTLTTAGYGDVLPVSWWARSLANLEMVVGVLYVTIIMARLVGLFTSNR